MKSARLYVLFLQSSAGSSQGGDAEMVQCQKPCGTAFGESASFSGGFCEDFRGREYPGACDCENHATSGDGRGVERGERQLAHATRVRQPAKFSAFAPAGLDSLPCGLSPELLPGSRAGTPVLGRTDRPPFGPGDIVTTETERSSGGHTVARQDAGATVEYNFASLRKVEEKL